MRRAVLKLSQSPTRPYLSQNPGFGASGSAAWVQPLKYIFHLLHPLDLEARSDYLVLTSGCLVVTSDCLVVTSDSLVLNSDFLVATTAYLVVTSDYLVVTCDSLVVTRCELVMTSHYFEGPGSPCW